MKKWDYYMERTTKDHQVNLGELGRQGWELVAVLTLHEESEWQDYKFIFKRELK